MPELLQDAATPEALSAAVIELLNDRDRRSSIEERFGKMALELRQDAAQRAAEAVSPYLSGRAG